jgi:membrane-associated protease RseP (regulator of RpoE activity)
MKTEPELREHQAPEARPPQSQEPDAAPMWGEPQTQRRVAPFVLAGLVLLLALLGGWPLLVVVFAIVVMIMLHELGHYLTAKWSGMKVTEYFLGFGPKLWSFRRGETEYGVKAIPAGAYVRIIGMNNLDEAPPEDEPRTYRQQSYPKRVLVASAGSAMHFLLALTCIFLILTITGAPGGKVFRDTGAWQIDKTVSADNGQPSAAQAIGLQSGDRITAINGNNVDDFDKLRDQIAPHPNETVTLTVVRNGQPMQVEAHLGDNEGRGFLGVQPGTLPKQRTDPVHAAAQSVVEFGALARDSVGFFGKFFSPSGLSNFAGQVASGGDTSNNQSTDNSSTPAPPPSSSSSSDGSNINQDRPVSIIGAASIGSDLTRDGLLPFLAFFAMINVVIGLFNLVPLPPLDGGHIAVATYERIRSRRGQRYQVDMAKLLPVTYAVVIVLVFIGLSTMYLDVVNMPHLN